MKKTLSVFSFIYTYADLWDSARDWNVESGSIGRFYYQLAVGTFRTKGQDEGKINAQRSEVRI